MASGRPVEEIEPADPSAAHHRACAHASAPSEPVDSKRSEGSRIVGSLAFDEAVVAGEVAARASRLVAVMADSVGDWGIDCLWRHDKVAAPPAETLRALRLPRLAALIDAGFSLDRLRYVRLFMTQGFGFVRPHRDWPTSEPVFTRYHVPLVTAAACLNSEGSRIYHMSVGEIWYLNGNLPHSGICLGPDRRIHLVLDFDPLPTPDAALRNPCPGGHGSPIAKAAGALSPRQRRAIHALSAIASGRNQVQIADALGTLHFEYDVACEVVYDWLDAIAARSGDAVACSRASELRKAYLGGP